MDKELASKIDHTLLSASASRSDIKKLCEEAVKYGFASVCVNPCNVRFARRELKGSKVKVCAVIGFPLGAGTTEVKVYEAEDALKNGADELDMVINIGAVKDKRYEDVYHDIKLIRNLGKEFVLKVILETCLLTKEEKIKVCGLAVCAKADFVKTSTGFSTAGAAEEDVRLLRRRAKGLKVKASGGIRDRKTALKMLGAGADRIGASASLKIVR